VRYAIRVLAQLRTPLRHNPGMVTPKPYLNETDAPTRDAVDALPGLTLLEFGTSWCGHCRAAQAVLAEALSQHPQWRHFKVEDGPGRALGRSYRVKLWPTLVLLRDGQEVTRLVRPTHAADISTALTTV
jgi:thioredoxin 1